jgi:hypothetical protein
MGMRFLLPSIVLLCLPLAADDESGFDAPPPVSWERFAPLAPYFPPSFDYSGGMCRIICPAPPVLDYGGTRGGLFAPTPMLDCAASVDITAWDPSDDRNADGIHMFVFTRVQGALGFGSLTGYAAVIIDMGANSGPEPGTRNGRLQIMRIANEVPAQIFVPYEDFPLDETHDYRLLLSSRGDRHVARVFDLANPVDPLAEIIVHDSTIALPGRTGIVIYNDKLAPVDVTFDNFLSWDGTPPPLGIRTGTAPGTVEITSDYYRSFASDMLTTTNLADAASWLPAAPTTVSRNGNQLVQVHALDGPRRFFRRGSL